MATKEQITNSPVLALLMYFHFQLQPAMIGQSLANTEYVQAKDFRQHFTVDELRDLMEPKLRELYKIGAPSLQFAHRAYNSILSTFED